MADTLDDVSVTSKDGWVDINAATSIPVGTAIFIQLKNVGEIVIKTSATTPDVDNSSGPLLSSRMNRPTTANITSGQNTVYVKSVYPDVTSLLSVQPIE